MKKLFLFLLLIIVFSCEPVEDFCWDCIQVKTNLHQGTAYYNPFTMCNKTQEEINDLEDTYTYVKCGISSVLVCEKQSQ